MGQLFQAERGSFYVYVLCQTMHASLSTLELGNVSCRVGFVFGLNLNGLKNLKPEPDLFNKRVENLNPNRLRFKRVDLNPTRLRPCFFGWLKQFNHSHPPSTNFNQLQPLLSTTKFHCIPFSTHFN